MKPLTWKQCENQAGCEEVWFTIYNAVCKLTTSWRSWNTVGCCFSMSRSFERAIMTTSCIP